MSTPSKQLNTAVKKGSHYARVFHKHAMYFQKMTLKKWFDALPGAWTLHRTITHPNHVFQANGMAKFYILNANTLRYEETGLIHEATQAPLSFTQSYRYAYCAEKDHLQIFSSQEVLLFTFDASSKARPLTAEHTCGQDHYQAILQLHAPTHFSIDHPVKGPRKNYESRTHFYRHAPQNP